MHAIVNGRIVLTDKILDGCALLFDKNIIGIVSRETLDSAREVGQSWKGKPLDITDACGNYVAPGFINLHIHGCGGADTMDAAEDSLAVMSRFLVQTGVTSFLPTTMTCDMQTICKALERVRKNMTPIIRRRDEKYEPVTSAQDFCEEIKADMSVFGNNPKDCSCAGESEPFDNKTEKMQQYRLPGAKVLGAYLEGPFISSKYKGAQNEDSIMSADFMQIKDFADVIKVVVLAPETLENPEQVKEFIARCKARNIIVSLGHSAADYDTALLAVREGASHVTHLCNAMTGLHHRTPGLLGAALDSAVTCELIADNLHVHPAVQRLIYHTKDISEIELITDSMRACGMADGIYELGGQTVIVENGAARLTDGTLAGSIVTLNRAMANFRKNTGATIPEVVRMVTENQAQELGLFEKVGSLSPGAAADVTIFNDDFVILQTFVNGREVYKNPVI
jgi:N-acetylglucosamine-6-phosphate deacetylase